MKISIITATIDPDERLRQTLESVASQTYADVEHIVIDSYDGERDESLAKDYPNVQFIKVPRRGVYAALNEGIHRATGDIIGLLHGNDRFAHHEVLEHVAGTFAADPVLGFSFGDIQFFDPKTGRKGAVYSAAGYNPQMLKGLFTPPHPSLYVHRNVAKRVGPYTTRYVIEGDLDMWVRLFALPGVRWHYMPEVMVEMSTGGLSTRLKNILWLANREKLQLMRHHSISGGVFTLLKKYWYAAKSRMKGYQHKN